MRKGQLRAELGQEIFCQGIRVSSMSYGTEAGRSMIYLRSCRQSVAKWGENLDIPSLQRGHLSLKHHFFHVRLIPHLGRLSEKGASSTPSTIERIRWEIKKWCDDRYMSVWWWTVLFVLCCNRSVTNHQHSKEGADPIMQPVPCEFPQERAQMGAWTGLAAPACSQPSFSRGLYVHMVVWHVASVQDTYSTQTDQAGSERE